MTGQRIKRQGGTGHRGKVAVNINDHIGRVSDVNADRSVRARRHDGRIGLNAAILRVQRRDQRLRLSRGAYLQSWLEVLKQDSGLVLIPAGQAQKAADMILQQQAASPQEVAL